MQELCKKLKPGDGIASFGYPDIIAPPEEIERVLGAKYQKLAYLEDSETVAKWHNVKHRIPSAHSFFGLQGATLHVYDVAEHRGCEIIADLNNPLKLTREYDFALDIGTMEHCFNIGQAALNMACVLKEGGVILHENPYNWGNHGFYNMNPTWYVDFYGQRGFELLDLRMIARNCKYDGQQVANVRKRGRFAYLQSEANIIAIAKRVEVLPVRFVVQGKYSKVIPDAGAAGEQSKEVAHG